MMFKEAITNMATTENGAITYEHLTPVIDFFFHGAALRTSVLEDEDLAFNLFYETFKVDPNRAIRILFYIRDIRGGQGEREVFRNIMIKMLNNGNDDFKRWFKYNHHIIPEFGRFDDLVAIMYGVQDVNVKKQIATTLRQKLEYDESLLELDDTMTDSLCAKWMPSENTSSLKTKKQARELMNFIGYSPKAYRQLLSKLRKNYNLVETNLSTKMYDKIDFSKLPSRARFKYTKAFYRHMLERYSQYLKDVANGKSKINTTTLYPYDIALKCLYSSVSADEIKALDTMWKNLPDYMDNLNGIVVADVSGSMSGFPMAISTSLAVYIAERNKCEAFKNVYITFSEKPVVKQISGKDIHAKICDTAKHGGYNTDLQKVFETLLSYSLVNKVNNVDMPKYILIISDMEFDEACSLNNKHPLTNYSAITEKYANAGYSMPTIVFWNVNSRSIHIDVDKHQAEHTILLSGASPIIFRYALSQSINVAELIDNIINSYRYKRIVYD